MPTMTKIDPELKKRWLKALRGRKYKQAQSCLRDVLDSSGKKGYCCLGVLADVIDPTKWTDGDTWGPRQEFWNFDSNASYLPPRAVKGLGKRVQKVLSNMNDDGKSFKSIARWIEDNL